MRITLHHFNADPARDAELEAWFEGPQRARLAMRRDFRWMDRFCVAPEQVMPDIPQPWRHLHLYAFAGNDAADEAKVLGEGFAAAHARGLILADDAERRYSFEMFSNWLWSDNHVAGKPLSHISFIFGNAVPGRETEYHRWYDDIHRGEVTAVPGFVGMMRGRLSPVQVAPARHCPGDQLVLCAAQTDNLALSVADFVARARGESVSGVAMTPRSPAASVARTVHYFARTSAPAWPGGIAYAGDLGIYASAT